MTAFQNQSLTSTNEHLYRHSYHYKHGDNNLLHRGSRNSPQPMMYNRLDQYSLWYGRVEVQSSTISRWLLCRIIGVSLNRVLSLSWLRDMGRHWYLEAVVSSSDRLVDSPRTCNQVFGLNMESFINGRSLRQRLSYGNEEQTFHLMHKNQSIVIR